MLPENMQEKATIPFTRASAGLGGALSCVSAGIGL
jgi:hypothetical protein